MKDNGGQKEVHPQSLSENSRFDVDFQQRLPFFQKQKAPILPIVFLNADTKIHLPVLPAEKERVG